MITQTFEQMKIAVQQAAYVPHKLNNGFSFELHSSYVEENNSTLLISPNCRIDLTGGVHVGRYVMISPNVLLLTHNHKHEGIEPLLLQEEKLPSEEFTIPINKTIEDDVWIYESKILANCNYIAKGVIIGIGSVVTKPINEEYSIWAGNPAKKISSRIK